MANDLRRVATIVVLYAGLVCWLTWPLALHLATHLPMTFFGADIDPLYSAWALSWESHTLASARLDLADANIYYPAQDALFYGPTAFGALPYFAPAYLLTGNPALALNLLLLLSFTLTATALHLVTHAWTRLHTAGSVAAAGCLFNRWLLLTFVPTVPHLAVLCYLPFIIFASAAPRAGWRANALLLLAVVLQCATDVVYVAPAVLLPLATIGTLQLVRRHSRRRGFQLLIVAVLAGVIIAALHWPYVKVAAQNPGLQEQTPWRLDPSKSPLSLPDGLLGFMSPLAMPSLVLGVVAAAGVLVLLRGWRGSVTEARAARYTLVWIAVGTIISLPRYVSWRGGAYELPHLAFAARILPVVATVRLSERLRVAALIGVALLSGLAFAEILRHLGLADARARRSRWLRVVAATLVGLVMYTQYEYAFGQPRSYGPRLPTRYRLREAPSGTSAVLRVLREAGGPTLELPLPRLKPTQPDAHAPAMYRSIFHWQPLLNGYSSFWPARFPELMALAARLPDPEALRELRRETGLAFVLVRLASPFPIDNVFASRRQIWRDLAEHGGRPDLRLVAADDELLLFRVSDER